MKPIIHSNFIYEYKNFVPVEVCEEIINYSKYFGNFLTDDSRNKIRNNQAFNLTTMAPQNPYVKYIDDIAHKYFTEVHQRFNVDNHLIKINYPHGKSSSFQSEYIYRKYDVNDYYNWHADLDPKKNFVLSYVLYLNEDYTGGNLLFHNDRVKISPSVGTFICFPTGYSMLHKATKVHSGNKHIIWSCFELVEF
jgi:hypothetical protein